MAARLREHATYEDLLKVPDNMVAELIEGELYASPRPRGKHVRAASALGFVIGPPYDSGLGGPGGWWLIDEPEVHLSRDVLVPDMAGWRHERLPELPEDHKFEVPPDWVCEITSPSTAHRDRSKKMPIYARAGVTWAWIINPEEQTLEVRRLEAEGWRIVAEYGGEDVIRAQPFEAVDIDLRVLWRARAS